MAEQLVVGMVLLAFMAGSAERKCAYFRPTLRQLAVSTVHATGSVTRVDRRWPHMR